MSQKPKEECFYEKDMFVSNTTKRVSKMMTEEQHSFNLVMQRSLVTLQPAIPTFSLD